MSCTKKKLEKLIQEERLKIKVDYETMEKSFGSFTFVLCSEKALVECLEIRQVLARLVVISYGVQKVHKNPLSIMNALINNALPFLKTQTLMFIFTNCYQQVCTVNIRVFTVTVLDIDT